MQSYGMFIHLGPMRSSKSERLIKNAKYFKGKGESVICFKVCPGSEEHVTHITSRAFDEKVVAYVINEKTKLRDILHWVSGATHVFVDELQFLTKIQLEMFMGLSEDLPVYLYGLMFDFLGKPFDNAMTLIEEFGWNHYSVNYYKANCEICGDFATRNMLKSKGGTIITDASSTVLVGDKEFVTCCRKCFNKQFKKGDQ